MVWHRMNAKSKRRNLIVIGISPKSKTRFTKEKKRSKAFWLVLYGNGILCFALRCFVAGLSSTVHGSVLNSNFLLNYVPLRTPRNDSVFFVVCFFSVYLVHVSIFWTRKEKKSTVLHWIMSNASTGLSLWWQIVIK